MPKVAWPRGGGARTSPTGRHPAATCPDPLISRPWAPPPAASAHHPGPAPAVCGRRLLSSRWTGVPKAPAGQTVPLWGSRTQPDRRGPLRRQAVPRARPLLCQAEGDSCAACSRFQPAGNAALAEGRCWAVGACPLQPELRGKRAPGTLSSQHPSQPLVPGTPQTAPWSLTRAAADQVQRAVGRGALQSSTGLCHSAALGDKDTEPKAGLVGPST